MNNTNNFSDILQSNNFNLNYDVDISIKNNIKNEYLNSNSKYKKNILNMLENISIAKYDLNPNLPVDPMFYDILCINCYECVKSSEVDFHSEFCMIQPEESKKIKNLI